jgi:hypothetical protein
MRPLGKKHEPDMSITISHPEKHFKHEIIPKKKISTRGNLALLIMSR